jgi:hypothetical protein
MNTPRSALGPEIDALRARLRACAQLPGPIPCRQQGRFGQIGGRR